MYSSQSIVLFNIQLYSISVLFTGRYRPRRPARRRTVWVEKLKNVHIWGCAPMVVTKSLLEGNFFHYRIGLDGQNFQFGALGALGIDVGAVSGGWGGTL